MFTMKFEIDSRTSDKGKTSKVLSVSSYQVDERPGFSEVTMTFAGADGGCDGVYVIGPDIDQFQRCYVMNEQGNTVHTIRPPANPQ